MARTGTNTDVDLDVLWQQFHDAVNMNSRELQDWLQTQAANETTEDLPDRAGPPLGREVVAVLGKRRTDLTDDDVTTMRTVIDRIEDLLGDLEEPIAGEDSWRHRLMNLGHDPLKPAP